MSLDLPEELDPFDLTATAVTARLLDLIQVGREATPYDVRIIRHHVAQVGFRLGDLSLAGGRLNGLVWQGHLIAGNMRLENRDVHFLRHVVRAQEWPPGTLLDDYVESLREAVRDAAGGILISQRWND